MLNSKELFQQKMRKQPGVLKVTPSYFELKVLFETGFFNQGLLFQCQLPWSYAGIHKEDYEDHSLPTPGQALNKAEKTINQEIHTWKTHLDLWEQAFEALSQESWRAQHRRILQDKLRQPFFFSLKDIQAGLFKFNTFVIKLNELSQQCEEEARNLWQGLELQKQVKEQSLLSSYPQLFPKARNLNRKWVAYLGPTNSGKTYHAFERLSKAKNGIYLAPLRLMALEGYERLSKTGIPCHLKTGEERILTEGATVTSSTIEMVSLSEHFEIAIIDEAQMLADPDRGWAWTQALVGVRADEIWITGSLDVEPLLHQLAAWCGDSLEIHHVTRKTPLDTIHPISIKQVHPGDALIAFSRKQVLTWKEELQKQGHQVACIYGSLGPEVRRKEALRFQTGEAQILVATDAIGMGLNLPIQRVILTSTEKYDGETQRELTGSEIRQIVGRAGRFGFSKKGEATLLLDTLQTKTWLDAKLQSPSYLTKLPYIQAPWSELARIQEALHIQTLHDLLIYAHTHLIDITQTQSMKLQSLLPFAKGLGRSHLSLETQHQYLGCPVGKTDSDSFTQVLIWAKLHGQNKKIPVPSIMMQNTLQEQGLLKAEMDAELLTAYLWLALRWPDNYAMHQQAYQIRQVIHQSIEKGLQAKLKKQTQKSFHHSKKRKN